VLGFIVLSLFYLNLAFSLVRLILCCLFITPRSRLFTYLMAWSSLEIILLWITLLLLDFPRNSSWRIWVIFIIFLVLKFKLMRRSVSQSKETCFWSFTMCFHDWCQAYFYTFCYWLTSINQMEVVHRLYFILFSC
jgi:hypothetical protein